MHLHHAATVPTGLAVCAASTASAALFALAASTATTVATAPPSPTASFTASGTILSGWRLLRLHRQRLPNPWL